jgi:proteasome lid subunit RPN8/RPN11
MLRLAPQVHLEMIGHCLDGLPEEACGLLGGPPAGADATVCYPTRNVEASARVYTVDPLDHLKADRDAEDRGLEIVGVFHSHTHTEAYPSPTDVAQAPDPGWHYVVVSLKHPEPVVRAFRIAEGEISEEPVVVGDR